MKIQLLFNKCNANFEIRDNFVGGRTVGMDREQLTCRIYAQTDARQAGYQLPLYASRKFLIGEVAGAAM